MSPSKREQRLQQLQSPNGQLRRYAALALGASGEAQDGELGLARRKATIWLSKEHLTVEFGNEPLSQYAVQYQSDEKTV